MIGNNFTKFTATTDYYSFISGSGFTRPNVSWTTDTDKVYYNPSRIIQAGEIVYLANSRLCVSKIDDWSTSLGTAQAVVVVPSNHTTDGTVRVMSLKSMRYDTPSSGGANQGIYWGGYGTDLSALTNYTKIPTTDNSQGTTTGSNSYGYLPSSNSAFTSATCVKDITTKYKGNTPYIPSPYLKDGSQNSAYIENASDGLLSGVNALSDFDGSGNTSILCSAATGQTDWRTASAITNDSSTGYYPAACCCYRYGTEGIPSGNWYLPACGELCYIIPRFKEINNALSAITGAVLLDTSLNYWSSTEYDSYSARRVSTYRGYVYGDSKSSYSYVRAFAALSLSSLSF